MLIHLDFVQTVEGGFVFDNAFDAGVDDYFAFEASEMVMLSHFILSTKFPACSTRTPYFDLIREMLQLENVKPASEEIKNAQSSKKSLLPAFSKLQYAKTDSSFCSVRISAPCQYPGLSSAPAKTIGSAAVPCAFTIVSGPT